MKRLITTLAAAGILSAAAATQAGEIVIGQLIDRTGPTANVGTNLGTGSMTTSNSSTKVVV